MRKLSFFSILLLYCVHIFAQGYNEDQTAFANFLKRMYGQTKFEGVKIVEDYDHQYFISVLSLERSLYKKQSDMFRVAQVKAMRQASEFVNGGTVSSDAVIRTTETKDPAGTKGEISVETVERIHSVGFVQGMELLISFTPAADDTQTVFIYSRKIEAAKEKK
ncbi:MAG: hypothetical protein LBK07_03015 [Tannerella sp.]|nr:hypothetical protein [Tannerella sp.]